MAPSEDQFIKCPWCGGPGVDSDLQRNGYGINVLTYVCRFCESKTVSFRDLYKEIESVNMTFNIKED